MGNATTSVDRASATITRATLTGFVAVAGTIPALRRGHATAQVDGLANTDRIPGYIAAETIHGTDIGLAILIITAL